MFQVSIFQLQTLTCFRIYFADVLLEGTNEAAKEPKPVEMSSKENLMTVEAPVQDLEVVSTIRNKQHSFNWSCVDVVGSPGLTRLIGALTIEEYGLSDDIPSLDLASNSVEDANISRMDLMELCTGSDWHADEEDPSTDVSSLARIAAPAKASPIVKLLEAWTQQSLQFELYPFPTTSNSPSNFDFSRLFSSQTPITKISESECLRKFQKLRQLQDVEISNLVDRMGTIAQKRYNSRDYATAESWYRRIVTAKQRIKCHKPEQTLWACVHIPDCVLREGQCREAQQLHKDLDTRIEQILGSEHPISIWSRRLKGDILFNLGDLAEADVVHRQLLQTCLSSLGLNHQYTFLALESLGLILIEFRKGAEARGLFETSICLRFRGMKALNKSRDFKLGTLSAMAMLAGGLDRDMKYDESERILDFAQKLYGKATRMKLREACQYHYRRACIYKHQGRLYESETILRGLLKYHQDLMTPITKINVFWNLAGILFYTGRNREEAYWLKNTYLCDRKSFGLLHRYTMEDCKTLGLCYANQRRYHKAKLFFGGVIKEMTSSSENPDSRMKCIQEVNAWMSEVEEMGGGGLEVDDFEAVELGIDEDADWEEMGDVPDPLL
jgi:tetratricopeptide (TPR) repeat protein